MAGVSVGSYTISDSAGTKKSVSLYLPNTMSQANMILYLQEFATLLDAAIDGKIEEARLQLAVALPVGLKAGAVANSLVENGALLNFGLNASSFSQSFFIPTWKMAGFTAKVVNNAGAYAALITAIVDHTSGTAEGACSEEGSDIDTYNKGYFRTRK